MRISYRTLPNRFWNKTCKLCNIHDHSKGCWMWTGSRTQSGKGYGELGVGHTGKKWAHHVAWWIKYNEWPELLVLHSCDNKACVNWDHLYEGTKKNNYIDMVERGLFVPRGKDHKPRIRRYKDQVALLLREEGHNGE